MSDRKRSASLFVEFELGVYSSSCPVSFFENGDKVVEGIDLVVRKEGRLECGISVSRCTGLSSIFTAYGSVKERRKISADLRLLVSILLDTFTVGGEGDLDFAVKEGR
jgi:hypothetical protein